MGLTPCRFSYLAQRSTPRDYCAGSDDSKGFLSEWNAKSVACVGVFFVLGMSILNNHIEKCTKDKYLAK